MLNLSATLPTTYLRLTVKQITDMGFDVSETLRRKGFDPDNLDDPSMRLTVKQYCQFIESMLALTNEPELGILVGRRLMFNAHGALGFAAINCENFLQLLNLAQKFISARTGQLLSIDYEHVGDFTHVNMYEYSPNEIPKRFTVETFAAAIKNVYTFVAPPDSNLHSVHFTFPKIYGSDLAERFFECPVYYGQASNYMVVRSDFLKKPLTTATYASYSEAVDLCSRELSGLGASESLPDKVRRFMRGKGYQLPSFAEVAEHFSMTTRSMHRKLKDDETSYKKLSEEIRHEYAAKMLRHNKLTIQEIAFNLGYSDVANFRRAFKRWENKSPMEYRESMLEDRN
ncbi:hypothetical protein CS022_11100 [Veronia nyctiphanis]|uniref:HTH araC/xylS-type domain-containing protein n=1 Tax=Veronia nyctiphanis TaxID=1278244 RepID=A0A4V1LSY0_9GAMM|nr:AraC family transcriptional regulator [Veronia nyctiphanis]RXJ73268.1 hypothetical protein CS022_11100 [Veronia nyctiphanis]